MAGERGACAYDSGVAVLAAIALSGACVIRTSWIKSKIAALSSPPSVDYTDANRRLSPKGQKLRVVLVGDFGSPDGQCPPSAIKRKPLTEASGAKHQLRWRVAFTATSLC